ncbi:helix-turn-helix transcriptional regulator [Paenibacillus sp. S3N08]|uniref:Helix-turn-helix transcriptional regulator n=2 Tax=Paenibacillus agricola TaxID=2716264 RepID=A0ABX0J8J5_9BACL|nr:helix-turn-helix transcriptional regulator [Paenibacillus agricola]
MAIKPVRCLIPSLLEERKMTQQQLIERTGIAKSTISAYSRFHRKAMTLQSAIVIAEVFGVHPRDLYEWDSE